MTWHGEVQGNPSRRQRYFDCEVCKAALLPQTEWNDMPADERAMAKADGYARQGVGPLCHRCTTKKRRTDGA